MQEMEASLFLLQCSQGMPTAAPPGMAVISLAGTAARR
jgi:hypothetical protein